MTITVAHNLLDSADCEHCPIGGGERPYNPIWGGGYRHAQVAIVGTAPSTFDKPGTVLSSKMMSSLWILLREYGLHPGNVYRTTALLCPTAKVTPRAIQSCRPRLYEELAHLPDLKVIICLGAVALEAIAGTKLNLGAWNGRVRWESSLNAHVVGTYNPAIFREQPGIYQDFEHAIRQAMLARAYAPGHEGIPTVPVSYRTGRTPADVLATLQDVMNQPVLAVDLETDGLDPKRDQITDVGLCWNAADAYIIPARLLTPSVIAQLGSLLCPRTGQLHIYHNGKFDTQFLRHRLGIDARIDGDTMLLHYALDERSGGEGGGHHDLKSLTGKYLGFPHYASEIDGRVIASLPESTRHQYQAYDLVGTFRLWNKLTELAEDEGRHRPSRDGYPTPRELHDELLVPAANAFADIELRGVLIHTGRLVKFDRDYTQQIEEARAALPAIAHATWIARCRATMTPAEFEAMGDIFSLPAHFNPNSVIQLKKLLYDNLCNGGMGYDNLGATDKATIHELQRREGEGDKLLAAILNYRSLKHTHTTYIKGILGRLLRAKTDGRLHTNVLIHGTTSGRLSSRDPNLQNIKKDSVVKNLFVPTPGHVMVEADYDQLEVRALWWYSRDPQLEADFRDPAADFHWNMASRVFPVIAADMDAALAEGSLARLEQICHSHASFTDFVQRQGRSTERTDDPKELYGWMRTRLRRQAKYVTFGKMYGEGAVSLSGIEKGLGVPVKDAQAFITSWEKTYPLAMRYLRRQIDYAHDFDWVESASGRRRRFAYPQYIKDQADFDRQAMNSPIQGFASDICLKALIALHKLLPERGLGHVLLSVHDSILFEIVEDRIDEAVALIREVMTNVVKPDPIPFSVSISSGASWGECH